MIGFFQGIIRVVASDFIVIPVVLAVVTFFLLKTKELKTKFVATLVIGGVLALIFAAIGGAIVNSPRPFVVSQNERDARCDALADRQHLTTSQEKRFIKSLCHLRPAERPLIAHGNDNGFPSDHTLLSSLLGFAILPFAPVAGLVTLLVALLIGTARVLAFVHHPIDIIASFVFAGVAVLIAYYSVKLYFAKRKTKKSDKLTTGGSTGK